MDIKELKKILANREFGENITIPKRKMPRIPKGCSETLLGDPNGALRQYRCDYNIHILEYPDRYKIHKDRVDPRKDPLGHVMYDSPETLAGLGMASISGLAVGKIIYDKRKDKSKNAAWEAGLGGILTAITTGFSTYYLLKNIWRR